MHRVFPPSKPPDGGYPSSFRLVVGGTQFRGSWYLSAIVRLQGFSSCSPVAPLRRRSPKTVTSSPWMGRGKPGCDLGPALSLKDVRHSCWGGERGEPGLFLPRGPAGHLFFQLLVVATILQLYGGDVLQPCRGRQTVAAQLGRNILPSSSLSWRGRERGPAGALWSGPLFGFNSWFASLEREREREPSGDRVRPGTMAAAAEVAGGSPGARRPAGFPVWRWNRSSVCSGTSNASVFVHCGCRVKGKCAFGPFLSILVIKCQHKCLNVNLCPWMNKVQIISKGMFLSVTPGFGRPTECELCTCQDQNSRTQRLHK
jgi:hypothetical protein